MSTLGGSFDGVYTVDGGAKQYRGSNGLSAAGFNKSEADFRNNPQFVRVEEVAGLKAFVLRQDSGDIESEASYSPKTGDKPLKLMMRTREGVERGFVDVKEALRVEFKDVSESDTRLPDLPVRVDIAKEKIEALRQAGQSDKAEMLEQSIGRLKANKK